MRLVIGSDHAGWPLKQTVIDHIRSLGHDIVGVGASIAANKMKGIRAAVCHDVHSAHQSVEHDDVNVMCIGAQIVGAWLAVDLVSSYLSAEFSTDEDFRRRVEKLRIMDEQG
jgi:ribose 5-phosphate isomerase B